MKGEIIFLLYSLLFFAEVVKCNRWIIRCTEIQRRSEWQRRKTDRNSYSMMMCQKKLIQRNATWARKTICFINCHFEIKLLSCAHFRAILSMTSSKEKQLWLKYHTAEITRTIESTRITIGKIFPFHKFRFISDSISIIIQGRMFSDGWLIIAVSANDYLVDFPMNHTNEENVSKNKRINLRVFYTLWTIDSNE